MHRGNQRSGQFVQLSNSLWIQPKVLPITVRPWRWCLSTGRDLSPPEELPPSSLCPAHVLCTHIVGRVTLSSVIYSCCHRLEVSEVIPLLIAPSGYGELFFLVHGSRGQADIFGCVQRNFCSGGQNRAGLLFYRTDVIAPSLQHFVLYSGPICFKAAAEFLENIMPSRSCVYLQYAGISNEGWNRIWGLRLDTTKALWYHSEVRYTSLLSVDR